MFNFVFHLVIIQWIGEDGTKKSNSRYFNLLYEKGIAVYWIKNYLTESKYLPQQGQRALLFYKSKVMPPVEKNKKSKSNQVIKFYQTSQQMYMNLRIFRKGRIRYY